MQVLFSFLDDFVHLLTELALQLYSTARNEFYLACFTGIVLAGGIWLLSRYVTRKFNRSFYRHWHHCLSGVAALIALCCTLLFFAFRFTGNTAELIITRWEAALEQDAGWINETFRKTYEAVYALHDVTGKQLEDFTGKPHPDSGQRTLIPAIHEQSKQAAAQIYADAVVGHFANKHPLLNKILWADSKEARQAIYDNMKHFFLKKDNKDSYPVQEVVQTARTLIRQSLLGQLPRVALISRIALVIFFFLTQAVIFSALIYSAVKDIKIQ